ncbi:hypothetical protein L1987_66762 [Smallanthus sonchifolius]|uniref:Uncharacterized protein n=1 Tax=Smallanthus sonchifolius TaxID=185202 RepID=A0ACB9BYA1_9ASTR|nr:hypothetical protein L1987_66762 [Smallanthus sonchifolius]
MVTQFSPKPTDSNHHSPSSEMLFPDRNCCFCIPYRWRKIPSSEEEEEQATGSLWSRGISALKKIREWSEIVAGPRWKTFIRRFNRSKSLGRQASKFQYDPLSYALNFDQGPLQSGDPEAENEYMIRNFSSRYVLPPTTVPVTGKSSMDVRRDEFGPSFV